MWQATIFSSSNSKTDDIILIISEDVKGNIKSYLVLQKLKEP